MAWSRFVERRRIAAAAVGIALLLALASPFLGVRFGFPDAGNDRAGTSTRHAYDTLSSTSYRGGPSECGSCDTTASSETSAAAMGDGKNGPTYA